MNNKLLGLSVLGLSLATTGCKLKDKLADALDGENDSYCETVCDWATACVDGYTTSMTQDEAYAACIEATEADDAGCGGAEDNLSIDDALLLNECNTAQLAEDCAALTGSETDIVKGTPPELKCMVGYGQGSDAVIAAVTDLPASITELNEVQVYKTFNNARNAVLDSGAAVCERWEETICGYTTECIADKTGVDIDQEYMDTTTQACIDAVFGNITDECISSGQWDSIIPIDYNPARYSAEECMDKLDEDAAANGACDIFTSVPPAICAGAYLADPSQVETIFSLVIDFSVSQGASF
jgi:hypothetical protein